MRFVFTDHIKFQMFNRNISETQIKATVNRPDSTQRDQQDPALTVAIREFTPGTFLKVWYRLEQDTAAVVSCILVTARRETPARTAARKTSPKKTPRKGRR